MVVSWPYPIMLYVMSIGPIARGGDLQLIQMAGQPKVSHRLLIWLVLWMLMGGIEAGLTGVAVSNSAINAIATYTWSITFNAGTPYQPLTLNFPTQVTVTANRTCNIGGSPLAITSTTNSIIISTTISTSPVAISCTNIQNPPSAISTSSFSYYNSKDLTVPLSNVNQVQFQAGTLPSCPWSFSLCTQQPSSDLTIAITTVNTISAGFNYFLIGYFTTWPNHHSKGLVSGGPTLTCSFSLTAGSAGSFSPANTCNINSLTIEMNFTATGVINAGTNIVVKISGVNSPPTMQTTTTQDYYIYTADSSMLKIDGGTSCAISNVCVTNQTVGVFTNTTMTVNANYGNPDLKFPITPFTITIQQLDTIDVSYSPLSSLSSCSTLILYRSNNPLYRMTSPTSGATSITFTMPSGSGYNTDYNIPIYAYLECTAFLMPPSETPVSLAFNFKRNSDLYLQLSTPVNALATSFNSSKGKVSQSTTAMISSATVTFNFLLGQPLGSTPAIAFTFTTDFVISAPSCSASILSLTVSSASCSNNGTNIVTVTLTTSSTISAGSNVTVVIISGVTNPATPKSYPIGMSTYYSSSVSSSKAEGSIAAFSTTITEISNYPVTLTPIGLTVYTPTDIVLSFTPSINIPISSTFYIEFPPNVTSITTNTNLLKLGTTAQPLVSGSLTSNSISVTFLSGAQINAGSSMSITIRLTTPSNIGTYSYVQLVISNNSTTYLSTKSSLYLNVNAVSSMSVTITPSQATAGKTTSYQFSIFLTIPHSSAFIVQVDVPSDTKFITTNSSCSSCNATSMSPTNSTTFSFIANNTATGSQSYNFIISSFTNPRSVGQSLPWGIATKTVSPTNLISYSYANATILDPNTLIATLDKTDSYFRSNTNPVKLTLSFYNTLIAGDYILFSFTSDSYTASSVTCSSIYGSCSIQGTPSNVTNVKMIPNTTSIISNSLFLILEGLTSASGTSYLYSTNISVTTLTSGDRPIDSGKMTYNISCGAVSGNLCKQCYLNGSCINCYSGFYLLGSVCLSACGPLSSYMSYNSSSTGSCVSCINSCQTCYSETVCKSCISGYYLFTSDSSCRLSCPTNNGYFLAGGNCTACITNCLECTTSSNSCTRCDSSTLLMSGACQAGCGSTNFYQLNGQCFSCNESCATCYGPGAGNCYACSGNYHMYLSQCLAQCPSGTAVNPSTGDCGCDPNCLTCSTYSACTACMNTSLWVLNGGCVSACPVSTYANAGKCISCSEGCLSCTINTCTTCVNGSYLFNNKCYSDCNLISQQYDAVGTSSCVLCPSGCDHCDGTNCTTCLDAYTLTGAQCIKTCLLSNSCDLSSQVMPMPGLISLVVWLGISVVIHLLYHKNYLPYSIILLSGVIQFVLILALLSSTQSTSARLLAADNGYLSQMRGLLGGAIAVNYLQNLGYLIIFMCYIKPLITNPRQIDVISNVVVLVIGTVTNFRFGLVAFARMFPKPNIFVKDASKLTPVHYLCLASLCLDLLSVVACGLGLINGQKLSNTFMLSLDLIIVIVINMAITIWFVAAKKPEEYFEDTVKKYHTEDNAHTRTDETLPNQKNLSKTNMVGNESFNFDDFDRTENDEASYNKLTNIKSNAHALDLGQESVKENPLPVTVLAKSKKKADPNNDPNFEDNIKSKRTALKESGIVISKADFAKSIDKDGKSVDDNLSARKNHVITKNLSKDATKSERKPVDPQKNIVEVEESDYPDMEGHSDKPSGNVFSPKQRPAKPKKVKDPKSKGLEDSRSKAKSPGGRKADDPMKLMKKGDSKKIGYFQSDAYQSNADGDDLEEIIKQKIWQSTIKLEKPSLSSGVESETGHEEISPSWFNIQNQRLDITDLEEAEQE